METAGQIQTPFEELGRDSHPINLGGSFEEIKMKIAPSQ